jgi:hypothetical protein
MSTALYLFGESDHYLVALTISIMLTFIHAHQRAHELSNADGGQACDILSYRALSLSLSVTPVSRS